MNNFYDKLASLKFVVRNVAAQNKTINIFGLSIPFGRTADLLAIPEVTEADIRSSLVKGELANKIRKNEIKIVASTIDLLQFDPAQAAFINAACENPANLASTSGFGSDTVTWAPFKSVGAGHVTTWAEAVAAVQAMAAPITYIKIEADPWHDQVVIPAGKWVLNNTMIVGVATYAQGGRNWASSQDYGQQGLNEGWQYYSEQYRGHQIKLWVHPEYDNLNPCKIEGCIGLKDMFFRGEDVNDSISSSNATYSNFVQSPYDLMTGTCLITVPDDIFSDADLFTNLQNDDNGWYVTVIEIIDSKTVKVDTQGYPTWLAEAPGGVVTNQSFYTENDDRNNATFNVWGKLGGKESYFSAYNAATGTSTLRRDINHGGPSSSDNYFDLSMIGKKIYVSNTNTNGGEFDGEYTIVHVYGSDSVEIDLNYDMTVDDGSSNKTVHWDTVDGTDSFVLDNVDFRSPYSNYGTLNLWLGNMYLNVTGGTSVRIASVSSDGFMVLQSDGSPCWLGAFGVYSYNGNGYLKIYALPGMNLNTAWIADAADINFDLYQGNIMYLPDNTGDWGSVPVNLKEALDQLAARVKALEP